MPPCPVCKGKKVTSTAYLFPTLYCMTECTHCHGTGEVPDKKDRDVGWNVCTEDAEEKKRRA
jgi:DnaJ-class molecular chaperone